MNRYFYIDSSGKQNGTFAPEELRAQNIKRDTLVWTNEMTDWKPAGEVEELKFLFADSAGYYPPQNPVNQPLQTPSQGHSAAHSNAPLMPKNWLIESILVTILPFVLCGSVLSLLGIVGIVSASKVESQYRSGDYNMAAESARQAKRWTLITFWITIGWVAILILAVIAMLMFSFSVAGISEMFESALYLV